MFPKFEEHVFVCRQKGMFGTGYCIHCPKQYKNFTWHEHSIQRSPCIFNKRLVVLSLMSIQTFTQKLCWYLLSTALWACQECESAYFWQLFLCDKHLLIYNNKGITILIFLFVAHIAFWISVGQNTTKHTWRQFFLAVLIHFHRKVRDSTAWRTAHIYM